MKAVIYTKTGGLEVVKQQSVQMPLPNDNQVLVEVKACALNIGDYQRFQTKNGKIPVSTHITNKLMGYVGKPLGAEIAGIVTKTGKNVTHVKAGDAVFGKTAGTAPVSVFKVQENLPHLPTSANYHQDIILHIQVVHQWQVHLIDQVAD